MSVPSLFIPNSLIERPAAHDPVHCRRTADRMQLTFAQVKQHNLTAADGQDQGVAIDKVQPPNHAIDLRQFIEIELHAGGFELKTCIGSVGR
jgi:hypothetical protein